MVVLLIGGASSLMDALIVKLSKDGHRVYLLTGQKNSHSSYKHVFEKYNFPYGSENVKDIVESIHPDVVVHTGVFDTNYDWSKAREESVRYTSDLMNLMMAFSLQKQGRFIYFSSQEVFENSHADNIPEDEPVLVSTFRGMAIAQGEEICRSYQKNFDIDTVILRFDNLYSIPHKGKKEDNPCFKQCLEAVKTGRIRANERNRFSMIYLSDAVEYAYQIIMKEKPEHDIYHITSMEEITEKKLAEMIRSELGKSVEIVNTTVGEGHRTVLDGQRYRSEYPARIFVPYEKGVSECAKYMKKNRSSYMSAEDTASGKEKILLNIKRIFRALFPFIENLIFFIPVFLLNNRTAGSQYFEKLDFYLLYVLLFAIIHGQRQAVFSAMLSVVGYFFRQMYERAAFEILIDYNTYVWIAQLLIVGLVVGYMKDRLQHIHDENAEEVAYLYDQLEDIEDINDSNVRIKHIFESQLINQQDSLGQVYAVTSELDRHDPEEVLFYAAEILSKLLNTKDAAIYMVANEDYARLISSTSKAARKFGVSVKYSAMDDMYRELMEQRVFINKKMDDRYPVMAASIFEGDRIKLILMLWNIPWERMNLAEANRLTVIASLIQNKVIQADRYLEALGNSRYEKDSTILNKNEFSRLVRAFLTAKNRSLAECTLLEILIENTYEEKNKAAEILGKKLYDTDYMGVLEDGQLYVLLTNTDEDKAKFIIEKFSKCGYASRVIEGFETIC